MGSLTEVIKRPATWELSARATTLRSTGCMASAVVLALWLGACSSGKAKPPPNAGTLIVAAARVVPHRVVHIKVVCEGQ
jgi:hypothetical protein